MRGRPVEDQVLAVGVLSGGLGQGSAIDELGAVKLAAGGQGGARRDQALADRKGVHQGVRLPGTARRLVVPGAPEVGDYAAVDEEGEGRS